MADGLSKLLREALREPLLWPLLAVLALVFATLGGGLLLFALVAGSWPARAALALLALMSADALVREWRARGAGVVTGLLAAFWLLSGLCALGARALGIF